MATKSDFKLDPIGGIDVPGTPAGNKKLLMKGLVIGFRDPDFDSLPLLNVPAAPPCVIAAYKLRERLMFTEMVADRLGMPNRSELELEQACINNGLGMSLGQVEFILSHSMEEWNPFSLLKGEASNLFFVNVIGNLVVVDANWRSDEARWYVYAYRFNYAHRWDMGLRVLFGNSMTLPL